MALIVILRDNQIESARIGAVKHGIGGDRPVYLDAFSARGGNRWRNLVVILGAEQTVFAAMRIDTGNRDARPLVTDAL
ncbi:hypothetical protein D3C86_2019570 [compost metagenome]